MARRRENTFQIYPKISGLTVTFHYLQEDTRQLNVTGGKANIYGRKLDRYYDYCCMLKMLSDFHHIEGR